NGPKTSAIRASARVRRVDSMGAPWKDDSGLRTEHVINRHLLDRPQIQRADPRLNGLVVANHDDGEAVGIEIFLRDALHVSGRHALDILDVLLEVICRQL